MSEIIEEEGDTTKEPLSWRDFNENFHSTTPSLSEIRDICEQNSSKVIDLKPYIIEKPFFVHDTDRLDKVVELFRLMNLRQLIVVNEQYGTITGIITRQDIFAFMTI